MSDKEMTDEEFLKNPDLWPRWPFCPIKKKHSRKSVVSGSECATVIDAQEGLHVLMVGLLDLQGVDFSKAVPMTAEEILAAGWIVD